MALTIRLLHSVSSLKRCKSIAFVDGGVILLSRCFSSSVMGKLSLFGSLHAVSLRLLNIFECADLNSFMSISKSESADSS